MVRLGEAKDQGWGSGRDQGLDHIRGECSGGEGRWALGPGSSGNGAGEGVPGAECQNSQGGWEWRKSMCVCNQEVTRDSEEVACVGDEGSRLLVAARVWK